jgi:hypothetical protein
MLNVPETCAHGCVGWCAACDWELNHPDLPGRAAVDCPVRACRHPMSKHRDGICTVDACGCGLPHPRDAVRYVEDDLAPWTGRVNLPNLIAAIAEEAEGEAPRVALQLRRALAVTHGRTW